MKTKFKKFPFRVHHLFQVGSFFGSAVIVFLFYQVIVGPKMERYHKAREAVANVDDVDAPTFFIIIQDAEQAICFTLMFWALTLIAFRAVRILNERALLQRDLVGLPDGSRILPEDSVNYLHRLQEMPREQQNSVLVRVLSAALNRFARRTDIQDVKQAAEGVCDSENVRMDAQLSLIRYVAWAVPSVGFVGTVRGIGQALGQAHAALEGELQLVTDNLGVAFNSTLVALLISIILMLAIHLLEAFQEGLFVDVNTYCEESLIANLHART